VAAPTDAAALRAALVAELRDAGRLDSPAVAAAFADTPRERFVRGEPLEDVYRDRPFVTHRVDGMPVSSSSQPAVMAIMLELLDVRPGDRVLEIGAGTGYNAALLRHLAGAEGRVVSVELDAAIADEARAHLADAACADVQVVTGDGGEGYAAGGPYDRVIVTAGAWRIPVAWIAQLREGGRLVLPLRLNGMQAIVAFERRGDGLASVASASGGFMHLRGGFGFEFAAELPGGVALAADNRLDDAIVAGLAARWDAGRGARLPLPAGSGPFDFMAYLALQGAPIVGATRRAPDGDPSGGWTLLVTSSASALRWGRAPTPAEAIAAPDVLGDDEALDFARAVAARWEAEGMPGSERLRVRVAPAPAGGSLGALPRPAAGRYRFARGEHAYECWFEPGGTRA
jgi:protein-L-isoaspartate(D-aspartate) O-methyltransferase